METSWIGPDFVRALNEAINRVKMSGCILIGRNWQEKKSFPFFHFPKIFSAEKVNKRDIQA
jgi:hypothetical protein